MSLIKCPECGEQISDKALSCPKCGCPRSEFSKEKNEDGEKISNISAEGKNSQNVRCLNCGRKIPANSLLCPHCGYKNLLRKDNTTNTNHSQQETNKIPFFQKIWFIVLACIFIPPVGIILIWISKKPKFILGRVLLTLLLCFWTLFWWFGFVSPPDSESNDATSESSIVMENSNIDNEENVKSQSVVNEQGEPDNEGSEATEDKNSKENFDHELQIFESGNYKFITNDDLNTYCPNLKGVNVYVVTSISEMTDGAIQCTLSDGFMMSDFNVGQNYKKYESCLAEDDMVAILGTVSGYTDYSVMGRSIELDNCFVFAKGEKAEQYKKESSDEELSQYFTVTEEVADLNEVPEDEYKALCESLDYEDILRNPNNYNEKYCVVSGNVDQIIEGMFETYTIYVEDSSGDRWECVYFYKDGESHLLEGDRVTVYGKCKGTTTATTLLGEQVTMPYVDVEYLN